MKNTKKHQKQSLEKTLKKSNIRWETSVKEDEVLDAIENLKSNLADMQKKLSDIEKGIDKMDEEMDEKVKYLGYRSEEEYNQVMIGGAKKLGMTFEEYEQYLIDQEEGEENEENEEEKEAR